MISAILLFLGTSCAHNADEYIAFMSAKDSPFKRERVVGEYQFEIQWHPNEYRALQKFGQKAHPDSVEAFCKAQLGMQYYLLKLGAKNGGSLTRHNTGSGAEQQSRVYYMSFDMQHDIYMEWEGERIPCSIFQFERGYDLAPHDRFLLGFATKHEMPGTIVVDVPFLDTGPVKLNFEGGSFPQLSKH